MATTYNEGFKAVLDHLELKNRQSIAAWEERLWRRQMRMDFVDPRDEPGRQFFRKHSAMLSELRRTAKKLQRERGKAPRSAST